MADTGFRVDVVDGQVTITAEDEEEILVYTLSVEDAAGLAYALDRAVRSVE